MTVRGESKFSQRRIKAIELQEKVLQLRKAGYSYSAISKELSGEGVKSAQHAHYCVKAACKRIVEEPAKEVVQLELERLDAILIPHLRAAREGSVQSAHLVLALMDRRAGYLGIKAPIRVETESTVHQDGPVFVVPGVNGDMQAWEKFAAQQQAALLNKEV